MFSFQAPNSNNHIDSAVNGLRTLNLEGHVGFDSLPDQVKTKNILNLQFKLFHFCSELIDTVGIQILDIQKFEKFEI